MQKILVIEDNKNNLYLIRYILEKNGFEVVEANKGAAGIELVDKEDPNLVLMDIQLPDINGLEVVKKIRMTKDVPIIAVTSYAMAGDMEKALAAGCNGYIEKPINPETIVAEIHSVLY